MKALIALFGLATFAILSVDAAQGACSCDAVSPSEGFDRAQYVFTGKVVKAEHHTWLIAAHRVWKGREKLAGTVKLMDIYAAMDCEVFFELGRSYIFFAIMAKGGRDVFYHPLACNWTSPLQSRRVVTKRNESLWIEDFIVRQHGPGERPR
jgi:hypothetical protein